MEYSFKVCHCRIALYILKYYLNLIQLRARFSQPRRVFSQCLELLYNKVSFGGEGGVETPL